jgi:hypothetical protein
VSLSHRTTGNESTGSSAQAAPAHRTGRSRRQRYPAVGRVKRIAASEAGDRLRSHTFPPSHGGPSTVARKCANAFECDAVRPGVVTVRPASKAAPAPVAAGHHCLAFARHGYRPGAPRTQPRSRDSMRGGQVALRDAREVTGRSEQVTSTWCPHTDSTTGRDKLLVGHRESHAVYAGGGLSLPSTPGELAYPPPILLVHLPWVATPSPRHSRQRRLSGRPRTGLITAASLLRRHQRAGRGPHWWPTRLAAVLTGE